MSQPNDLSRSFVALEQDKTLIAVVEMSQSNWLTAAIVPGVERQPLHRWCFWGASMPERFFRYVPRARVAAWEAAGWEVISLPLRWPALVEMVGQISPK